MVPAHLIHSCAHVIQASCTVDLHMQKFCTIQILYLHGMHVALIAARNKILDILM